MIAPVEHILGPPDVGVASKTPHRPRTEPVDQQIGFTKIFRLPVPREQSPQPTTVEVVGSFSDWQRVPLAYNKPTRTWETALSLKNNHTHRYVFLIDGTPAYDETCDGLTAPQSPTEAKWQIPTAHGPRVMLLFARTN